MAQPTQRQPSPKKKAQQARKSRPFAGLMRSSRPAWVMPAAVAALLLAGIGIGVGVARLVLPSREAPAVAVSTERPATVKGPVAARLVDTADDEAAPAEVAPSLPSASQPAAVPAEPPSKPAAAQPQPPAQPSQQTAMLPVAPPPSRPGHDKAAWLRFAVPPPDNHGKPMIAIVIDDMGVDRKRADRTVALPGPLTLSFMTYANDLARQTSQAHARGHELMVHMPMEPLARLDAGPNALTTDLPPEEIRRRVDYGLGRFSGFIGVNNHMGSKFSAYGPGMQIVMEELRKRGLMFLDSRTSEKSVGMDMAAKMGVATVGRDIFLDNEMDTAAVRAQLAKTEEVARRRGYAIAIGHPHDGTIEALAGWLPGLEHKGFALVPVSTIVKRHFPNG